MQNLPPEIEALLLYNSETELTKLGFDAFNAGVRACYAEMTRLGPMSEAPKMETNEIELKPGGFAKHIANHSLDLICSIKGIRVCVLRQDSVPYICYKVDLIPIPTTPELLEQFRPMLEPVFEAFGLVQGPRFKVGDRVITARLESAKPLEIKSIKHGPTEH